MLSIFATVVSILNGCLNLFKAMFGCKSAPDAASKAVEVSNEVGHVAAEVSRDTSEKLNQDIQNANDANSAAVDAVRSAGSVREQQSAVDDAIARANAPADPHG